MSEPRGVVDCAVAADVAGVQSRGGLEQEDVRLFVGHGAMFRFSWYNDELAFFEPDVPVSELHAKATLDHEEELVFVFMMMPEELALEFNELDELSIQLADDSRTPVIVENG